MGSNSVNASVGAGERSSVLGKAFRILECFEGPQPTFTLAELSERTGLPKSTVLRIATRLVEWGALEKLSGEYQLGIRVFALGGLVPRWRMLRETALPYMQDLYDVTRQTVHLAQVDGTSVFYLEKLRGHQNLTTVSRVGGRAPLHSTAVGKVLLAYGDAALVDAVLNSRLKRSTAYTIGDGTALQRELECIAREGVAYDREETSLGLACVAAPILNFRGHAVAALSVSVPTSCFKPNQLSLAIRTAASALSRALRSTAIE